MVYNIKKKRKNNNKDIDYHSSRRPLGSRVMAFSYLTYLSNVTPSPYRLSHVKNEFALMELTVCQCENSQSKRESVRKLDVCFR